MLYELNEDKCLYDSIWKVCLLVCVEFFTFVVFEFETLIKSAHSSNRPTESSKNLSLLTSFTGTWFHQEDDNYDVIQDIGWIIDKYYIQGSVC